MELPLPITICQTPSGSPASYMSSIDHSAVSAVWVSGFWTTALPAARAAMVSLAAMLSG